MPQEYLKGGAAVSGSGVETLDMLAVVVPPEMLLSRLDSASARGGGGSSSGGNLFPALGHFVDGIRCVYRASSQAGRKEDTRIRKCWLHAEPDQVSASCQ